MNHLHFICILVGSAFLITWYLGRILASRVLQKTEEKLSPGIINLVQNDILLTISNVFIGIFIFFSFLTPLLISFYGSFILWIWFFLFAISLALLFYTFRKQLYYMNPFDIVDAFVQQAKKSLRFKRTEEFVHWIDALSEIAIKALRQTSITLSDNVLKAIETLTKEYLLVARSLKGTEDPEQIYYSLGFILQRIDFINSQVVKEKLDPISNQILIILGKIAFYSSQYDPEMSGIPLHFLAKCAKEAQTNGISEANLKASIVFQEVAKNILDDEAIKRQGVKVPLLNLISHLEEMAKTTFRENKNTNILVLMQPFQDLKNTLQLEKNRSLVDSEIIISDLDRILGEFDALTMVLRNVPNIPGYQKEENSEGT